MPHGLAETTELHGYELMQGKRAWLPMKQMLRARIGIYDKAMAAVGTHAEQIITRGVYVPGLARRYANPLPPHNIALQHVMERIDEYAESVDQPVLLIADEVSEAARHRQDLWEYQRQGTPGYRPSLLPRIVDTIHFAPSHASRLVQAADLVMYLYCRLKTHTETDERAVKARQRLWQHVSALCRDGGCWRP